MKMTADQTRKPVLLLSLLVLVPLSLATRYFTWFEGLLLVGVYVLFGLSFFFPGPA